MRRSWKWRRPGKRSDVSEFERLNSPFVSLIEGAADVPDQWFLDRLGMAPPSRAGRQTPMGVRHVLLGEVGSWKILADTYWYVLWFTDEIRPLLGERSSNGTVFSYHFGESDDSHAIRVLQGGEIEREWIVDDQFGGGAATAVVDTGEPLEGERGVVSLNDECAPYFRRLASTRAGSIEDGLKSARAWAVSVDRPVDPDREQRLMAESWTAHLR